MSGVRPRRTALLLWARDQQALGSVDRESRSCTVSVRDISDLTRAGACGPCCASRGTRANATFTFANLNMPVLGAVETTRFCTVGPSVEGQITRWHMRGKGEAVATVVATRAAQSGPPQDCSSGLQSDAWVALTNRYLAVLSMC